MSRLFSNADCAAGGVQTQASRMSYTVSELRVKNIINHSKNVSLLFLNAEGLAGGGRTQVSRMCYTTNESDAEAWPYASKIKGATKNPREGGWSVTTADVGGTRAVGDPPLGERCSP